jgi:hypothetical protein
MFSGRRQPSCDDTSRMTRECHVRICERLGVKFPGPTRQKAKYSLRADVFRFAPDSGLMSDIAGGPFGVKARNRCAIARCAGSPTVSAVTGGKIVKT